MPITIHGKEYITVAERVQQAHEANPEGFNVETEVLLHEPVVIRACLTINGKVYTGMSAANPSKTIEKQSPYEVAETSAVGRALGFAGFGIVEGIASADEIVKAELSQTTTRPSKSLYMPTRTMEQHESGKLCKKCNSTALSERTSQSENSMGRSYYYCNQHKGFSHWVKKEEADEQE